MSEKVFLKDPAWIAPLLWRSEFKNVVLGFLRKDILDFAQAIQAIDKAERKMQGREFPVSSVLVMELARDSGCSSYDCEFVALARTRALTLLTWDKQIRQAFPDIALQPEAFVG